MKFTEEMVHRFNEVSERFVYDDQGRPCEVKEQF